MVSGYRYFFGAPSGSHSREIEARINAFSDTGAGQLHQEWFRTSEGLLPVWAVALSVLSAHQVTVGISLSCFLIAHPLNLNGGVL